MEMMTMCPGPRWAFKFGDIGCKLMDKLLHVYLPKDMQCMNEYLSSFQSRCRDNLPRAQLCSHFISMPNPDNGINGKDDDEL